MSYRLRFAVRQHRLLLLGVGVVVAGLAAALLLLQRPASGGPALMGDTSAPAAYPAPDDAAVAMAATAAAMPTPALRPVAEALSPAAAGLGPIATEPDVRLVEPVLAGLNCARRERGGAPIVANEGLTTLATTFGRRMIGSPDADPSTMLPPNQPYAWILPLALKDTQIAETTGQEGACVVGGVSLAELNLGTMAEVGIAVFPDRDTSDGYDDTTVFVVGR